MTDWTLDIKDMSWTEHTAEEVDFIVECLQFGGQERVLDLACGFGRHSLELARRGYSVVGVDITPDYIADAQTRANAEGLDVEFICSDALHVRYREEFDAVLNMADGAIGYFENEGENLRLFDVIANALRVGGKTLMAVCSAAHANKHFPMRCWDAGSHSLSLADFHWNAKTSRMLYRGHFLRYGEVLKPLVNEFPEPTDAGIRLYTLKEMGEILSQRGLSVTSTYGAYDTSVPASESHFMQIVCARKGRN